MCFIHYSLPLDEWKPLSSSFLFYSTCSIYSLPKGPHPPPSPACDMMLSSDSHACTQKRTRCKIKNLGQARFRWIVWTWWDSRQTSWGESQRARASSRVCLRWELAWGEDTETYYDNLGVLYLAYCCRTRSNAFLSKRRRRGYAVRNL